MREHRTANRRSSIGPKRFPLVGRGRKSYSELLGYLHRVKSGRTVEEGPLKKKRKKEREKAKLNKNGKRFIELAILLQGESSPQHPALLRPLKRRSRTTRVKKKSEEELGVQKGSLQEAKGRGGPFPGKKERG